MKILNRITGTVLTLLCSITFASSQGKEQALTFEEAFQMMNEQNPGLLQARQQVEQKEYELKAKKGLYLPRVALSAKAVAMSDKLHLDLTPVKDALTPLYGTLGNYGVFSGVPNPDPATRQAMPFLPDELSTAAVREKFQSAGQAIENASWDQVIQEKNFAAVSADVAWPLFTGGKIKGANDAARTGLAISQEQLRHTQGVLLTELATRYYGVTLGMQVLGVRQQMVEAAEQHYADAQKLYDNGMIAKVELLNAGVARNEAERQFREAQRNIKIIRSGLDATLSFDTPVNVLPVSHLFMNNEIPDVSYWITTARQENPQIRQIDEKRELVNIKNRVDKGNYLPTVALIGTYNLAEKDLSPYVPDWMVGVGLKWTLFDGLGRHNTLRAGKTMERQVNLAGQKAQADLQAYLTQLHEQMQMQMEQKRELEGTLELAEAYLESTRKAFSEGLATSTSVVEAYTKVAQVKALRLKVFYDYDVTLATLLQVAGVPEQFLTFCTPGKNTSVSFIN